MTMPLIKKGVCFYNLVSHTMYISHEFTIYQIPPWHIEQAQCQTDCYTQDWHTQVHDR